MAMMDGMNYAPTPRTQRVACEPGEFRFAVAHMDHGHIFGMTDNLVQAGGQLQKIYEPDKAKANAMKVRYPEAQIVDDVGVILDDPLIQLVAAAAIPNLRGPFGVSVMESGKDYFTDKTPFTTLAQLDAARDAVNRTGQKYAVCYSERLQNEAAEFAVELIRDGVIGEVVQVIGLGPHRLNALSRPDWFFLKEQYGGIICDIGSHQVEQFLTYTGSSDATITMARTANFANPATPELEDFGECSLIGSSGASGYFRMDWFTPAGLRTWGDGRTTILGTKGYIECRKYIEIAAADPQGNTVYVVTESGEERHNVTGRIGFPFFPAFIEDCLNRTETAMTQEHCFKAAELCLLAQQRADTGKL
jgi:predicted dehydrogenase